MFRGGQPYTEFKAVNARDGRIRFEGKPFGVTLQSGPISLSADRKVYLRDGNGSMFVKGYHIQFGTFNAQSGGETLSLVPTGAFKTVSYALTGIHTTSIVFCNIVQTAYAGSEIMVAAARCKTDGYLQLHLTNVTAGTVDNGTMVVSYVVMHPQTS